MEISDREFHRLVDYMHDNFGINLSSKRVLIQGRLGNMLRERGFTSYDPEHRRCYGRYLRCGSHNDTQQTRQGNYTFFMREAWKHYTYLKR